MADFLKAFPFISMEQYMWGMSYAQIRLMSADNTRVHYLSEKEAKRKKAVVFDSAESLMNDLGIPIISREQFEKR